MITTEAQSRLRLTGAETFMMVLRLLRCGASQSATLVAATYVPGRRHAHRFSYWIACVSSPPRWVWAVKCRFGLTSRNLEAVAEPSDFWVTHLACLNKG